MGSNDMCYRSVYQDIDDKGVLGVRLDKVSVRAEERVVRLSFAFHNSVTHR